MFPIDAYHEKLNLLNEWFSRNNREVKPAQFLLAVDYVNNYGYPVETACLLALDSYRTGQHRLSSI
jgi:hypothetical protein